MIRTTALAGLFSLLAATAAVADVRDFIGKRLVDVRVEVGGVAYTEPSVLQLIETEVGEPLSMERVRESIDHLVGLGQFEDVRVFAAHPPSGADGVTLRWVLVPVQRIAHVEIDGPSVYSDDASARSRSRHASPTSSRPCARITPSAGIDAHPFARASRLEKLLSSRF
jgi:outer membrane protein assembly factor BamA